MARSSKLERRIRAILDSTLCRAAVSKRRLLITIAAAFMVILPIAALRAAPSATQSDFKPRLQFRLVVDSPIGTDVEPIADANDPGNSPLHVSKDVLLDERSVASVSSDTDNPGHRVISIRFTDSGAKEIAGITTANVGHRLAVILDGKLLTAPRINDAINGGKAIITTAGFTEEEAASIVDAAESAIRQTAPAAQADPGHPRIRHFVQLVVAPDRMTFQGADVTWNQLPAELQKVPDRANTVLCVGYSSDQVTLAQFNETKFGQLAQRYGFAYLSIVGQKPIGTKGRADMELKSVAEVVRLAVNTISTCAEGDPKVLAALESLKSLPESDAVKELADYLGSDVNEIRRAAIYALWQGPYHRIDAAVDPLLKLCNHSEDYTRGMAALALGARHVQSAEPLISNMATDDSSPYARRCAAYALGLMGDPAAMDTLEKVARDHDAQVAANAKLAIKMLQTP